MQYRPFDEHLGEVIPSNLARLKDIHEGWYVEYKRELIALSDLAKSMSSFANQYGGWLFIGVEQGRETNVAAGFPGVPDDGLQHALESIRNAAADYLQPPVFYDTRVISGPVQEIGLETGRSIIIIEIPQGPNSPYIHNNGRIYRRIGDSSKPERVTDRATFDLLAQRGQEARSRLEELVLWIPETSKGEEDQPYIHISVMSDPYEVMGHWYEGEFEDFCSTMKGGALPFDNIFSMSNGYVARQVNKTNPHRRGFTWHFSRPCHSFVTLPISHSRVDASNPVWMGYRFGGNFIAKLQQADIAYVRILDLNQVVLALEAIMRRHRTLAGRANVTGPFYLKAHIENVWRAYTFC